MADLLELDNVSAGYGNARVLHGVSLSLAEGGSLALLGRNGVGKTTLINTIVGQTRLLGGTIRLDGRSLISVPSHRRALAGIGWVPQERNIFRSLTVDENLTAVARPGPWTPAAVYELFPRLGERRRNWGNQLSGGEQQMLAIARALVTAPRLLLLDEPLEGLAPVIVDELLAVIGRLIREHRTTIVIVEQNVRRMLALTDRAAVLERGSVVYADSCEALVANPTAIERYIGLSARANVLAAG